MSSPGAIKLMLRRLAFVAFARIPNVMMSSLRAFDDPSEWNDLDRVADKQQTKPLEIITHRSAMASLRGDVGSGFHSPDDGGRIAHERPGSASMTTWRVRSSNTPRALQDGIAA